MKMQRLLFASVLVFIATSISPIQAASRNNKGVSSSTGFQFPNPEIPISRAPKTTEEKIQATRLWVAQYTQQFIAQFLLMNGLRENLFNVREILRLANKQIDAMPPSDFDDIAKVTQRIVDYRNGMMALADKLYAKERPSEAKFSGNSRLDVIENRISELRNVNSQISDITQKLESYQQRLMLVEQRKLPSVMPTATVVDGGGDPKATRLAWAALLLAAGSLFLQVYGRKK